MLDGMELFGMGASWGGYESLILPTHPERMRSAKNWQSGPTLRLHAGLEDLGDLICDLERGFSRLNAARLPKRAMSLTPFELSALLLSLRVATTSFLCSLPPGL